MDMGLPMIVGATDRMVSTGDTEFEPATPKVYQLGTAKSAVLVSGDGAAQASIIERVADKITAESINDIREVAQLYALEFAEQRRRIAEATYLHPLGLTTETFLRTQRDMDPETVQLLLDQLQKSRILATAIVAGITPPTGRVQVYVVSDPGVAHLQISGFGVAGIGAWHARSEFTFAKYDATWPLERATFMVYRAKKKAEAAPGVGVETDMFFITLQPPSAVKVSDEMIAALDGVYQRFRRAEGRIVEKAEGEVTAYVRRLRAQAPPKASIQEQGEQERAAAGPDHAGGVRGDAEKGQHEATSC
jgi:hypothetical protein